MDAGSAQARFEVWRPSTLPPDQPPTASSSCMDPLQDALAARPPAAPPPRLLRKTSALLSAQAHPRQNHRLRTTCGRWTVSQSTSMIAWHRTSYVMRSPGQKSERPATSCYSRMSSASLFGAASAHPPLRTNAHACVWETTEPASRVTLHPPHASGLP